ncbi:multidrug transporter [Salinivibrio proteolyticus]|uniref:multidrug transporter n=1 Tax=Salinivibrio proteolyticus TaxID=334715 RepID=UPI00098909A3|nr:multidrug transporter [Salinivibrio proteolyticus]OOF30400.1 multidrug transporter [Salinivibrio proteolyticus]
MNKIFKLSTLAAAVLSAGVAMPALSQEATADYSTSTSPFFSDATISGNLNFWMRSRDRAGTDANGNDTAKETNLDHGSIYANLAFNSGYAAEVVGLDLMAFSTFDMWQNGSPDHEMNFWGVNNPFDKEPDDSECTGAWDEECTDNGISLATAAAKFKFGDNVTAKLGYFQPSVPSTIGVNWSFAPGTHVGGELGLKFDNLNMGLVVSERYKAPWFKETYEFQTTNGEDAGTAYSLGARYTMENGISIDAAYGALTDGDRWNAHVKVKGTTEGGVYWSPQLYVVDDDEQYDSTAFQLAMLTSMSSGQYSYRAEATYTEADSGDPAKVENLAYRLTSQYGGSNGTYDIWWNNRSDFNHDEELALFGSLSRDFSDIGAKGFSAGFNGAYGFGSSAKGYDDLKEYSYSLFANYAIQNGALKDAKVSFYFTQYFNDTDAPSWNGYTNLFQDEDDFKLTLAIPFSIK